MDLIFKGGEKLYLQQQTLKFIEKYMGEKSSDFQKQILNQANDNTKIYGDDFLIEIIPKNCADQFILSIQDYDEKQEKECEINISFSEQELAQLINQLQFFYNTWI